MQRGADGHKHQYSSEAYNEKVRYTVQCEMLAARNFSKTTLPAYLQGKTMVN